MTTTKNKPKRRLFKMGAIVKSKIGTVILVSGKGNYKKAGYKCFAGVVIFDSQGFWKVGEYSETWDKDCFH